jgi:hypothetical protein
MHAVVAAATASGSCVAGLENGDWMRLAMSGALPGAADVHGQSSASTPRSIVVIVRATAPLFVTPGSRSKFFIVTRLTTPF